MGPVRDQLPTGRRAVLTKEELNPSGQTVLTALVARRTPTRGAVLTAAERNVRPVEATHDAGPAELQRQGDVPSRPSRQPIVTFLNLSGIKAVMRDEFWINIIRRPGYTQPNRGRMQPWMERVNVHRPSSEPWGDQLILDPGGSAGFTSAPVHAGMP